MCTWQKLLHLRNIDECMCWIPISRYWLHTVRLLLAVSDDASCCHAQSSSKIEGLLMHEINYYRQTYRLFAYFAIYPSRLAFHSHGHHCCQGNYFDNTTAILNRLKGQSQGGRGVKQNKDGG